MLEIYNLTNKHQTRRDRNWNGVMLSEVIELIGAGMGQEGEDSRAKRMKLLLCSRINHIVRLGDSHYVSAKVSQLLT